jgi:hypothetical protein
MKYAVLSKSIPQGGRWLSSEECRRLRKHGVSCSVTWRVMPNGAPHIGTTYKLLPNDVWSGQVTVTTQ